MRPFGSAKQLHRRRVRAIELLKHGLGPTDVAKRVHAHRRTVQRWARAFEAEGRQALAPTPHPGPRSKLTPAQKQTLSKLLLKGAKACGFSTDLWTCPRVARVIHNRFGVRYHVDHIGRFLRALGWTPQKPQRKAYERDEAAIAGWVTRDWPRIKKKRAD